MTQEERWLASNGNYCFRFPERQMFEKPWIIILAVIILIAGSCIELFIYGSCYSIMPAIIFLFFIILWWMTIPMKANEAVIEKTIHELMDDIVKCDAKAFDTEVVKSFVYYDTKGSYGIITSMCFLVLLKNEVVWEYPIEYHQPKDDRDGYYECDKHYKVAENQEHIRAIYPNRWNRLLVKMKVPDKVKLWLLVFAILVIGGVAFVGILWLFVRFKLHALLIIGGYIVLYEASEWIVKRFPVKFTKACRNVIIMPINFLFVIVDLAHPFITIAGSYFLVVLYTFGVPVILIYGLNYCGWLTIRPETIAFIVIALGSVLSSTYLVTQFIIKHSPLKNWDNHLYESHREQLALYMVHPSNMVFLLYLLYVIYLSISGYMLIQNDEYIISKSYDLAILKAFLVYIAYTNMKVKAKETEIEAKVLLKRISGLFVHDRD